MLDIRKGAGRPGEISLSNAPFGAFGSRLGDPKGAPVAADQLAAAYRGILAARKGTRAGLVAELALIALAYMAEDTSKFAIHAYEANEVEALVGLGQQLRAARATKPEAAEAPADEAPEADGEEALPF